MTQNAQIHYIELWLVILIIFLQIFKDYKKIKYICNGVGRIFYPFFLETATNARTQNGKIFFYYMKYIQIEYICKGVGKIFLKSLKLYYYHMKYIQTVNDKI